MMKNDTLLRTAGATNVSLAALFQALTLWLSRHRLFAIAAKAYSFLLGSRITSERAVKFFYAQLTALAVLLPFAYGAGWRMCFAILFVLAARSAMEGLNLPEEK